MILTVLALKMMNHTFEWVAFNGGSSFRTRKLILININVGTYQVSVTDSNGCTKIEEFEITEPNILNEQTITVFLK